jgi:ectoine hydroxylase-related dioxygenase (phytanoyl-CoA dioxygenase family)
MTQTRQFKIIPDDDELDRIERDLRFHPLGVENPSTLTREQIAAFNRDGFLKGIHIFNRDEIATHRRHFDDLLERVIAAGGDSYSISTAHLKYPQVYDLLAHPRIVAVVKDMLGQDVIGWGSHYFCKMPCDGKRVSWHQDASYWPLTPSKTVTVWLAIDDADVENACMRFIPGSHLYGHLTWHLSEADEGNVLNQSVADVERFGAPVDDVLRAGEISIHSDLTLHGSESNDSDRRRCGLTLRYCAADVRAHLGWNAKGVVVSGADADGHWANAARPE